MLEPHRSTNPPLLRSLWAAPRRRASRLLSRRRSFQVISLVLLVTLLPIQAPAASGATTPGIPKPASERRLVGTEQETQQDREARVAGLAISPGDVTLPVGGTVIFAAAVHDATGTPIIGVPTAWRAVDIQQGDAATISPTGQFTAVSPGTFQVTVEAHHQQATVTVTVLGPDEDDTLLRVMALPDEEQAASRWDDATIDLASQPESRRGGTSPTDVVTHAQATLGISREHLLAERGVGSGNYTLDVPLLHLPGRGQDLSLGMTYNARLWQKLPGTPAPNDSPPTMQFNVDGDWPVPGWRLGYGKLVRAGGKALLIDPDGTRHPFCGSEADPLVCGTEHSLPDGSRFFTGRATDGSLIGAAYTTDTDPSRGLVSAFVGYPDGTRVAYTAPGLNGRDIYPTQIKDRNGNIITITYLGNRGPNISTITDTLGRLIQFVYGQAGTPGEGLPVAITAPDLNGSCRLGSTDDGCRTVVRLHYDTFYFTGNIDFAQVFDPYFNIRAPGFFYRIDAITFPATGDGYYFAHPPDPVNGPGWSPYGMMRRVSQRRGMVVSTSDLANQGNVSVGSPVRDLFYDYPATAAHLDDAPTYLTMTEVWAEDHTGAKRSAATQFLVLDPLQPASQLKVTYPNGTSSLRNLRGAIAWDETLNSAGIRLRRTDFTWERGVNGLRRKRVATTDELGQVARTEYGYGVNDLQVTSVSEYGFDGALARLTGTEFFPVAIQSGELLINHLVVNRPKKVWIQDGTGTIVSQTEYVYDELPLAPIPNDIVQHQPYENSPVGNLTRIRRLVDVPGGMTLDEIRRYDEAGNVVESILDGQHRGATFHVSTQYAFATSRTVGGASPSPRLTTSATYNIHTGLVLTSTDANGRQTQYTYAPRSLRPLTVQSPTNASVAYQHDDQNMMLTTTMRMPSGSVAGQQVTRWDGRGQTRQSEILVGAALFDVVESKYDDMGRVSRQSRPFSCAEGQRPDCSGSARLWSQVEYDALGRAFHTVAPDGSETRTEFNGSSRPSGASATPGQTVLTTDAWGRQRWTRTDALGRLVEVLEPNPGGGGPFAASGNLATTYQYDARDLLVGVRQGAQARSFRYDGLGRLTHQRLAEKQATLNDAGILVGSSGRWSDVFVYDNRTVLLRSIDARGAVTAFDYGTDPLLRLQRVTYTKPNDPQIIDAPAVSFEYVPTGDVTRPFKVTVDGVGNETFTYDGEGRSQSITSTFASRPSQPLVVEQAYDSLHRPTDLRYPAQHGQPGAPRKLIHFDYDVAGRSAGLNIDGVPYASGLTYQAGGQLTALEVGPPGPSRPSERFSYDSETGALQRQQVRRDRETLLDLSYGYRLASGGAGQTGQLTTIRHNLQGERGRAYEYDALGRLAKSSGGSPTAPRWSQEYTYDQYGNRSAVRATGVIADGSEGIPQDGWATITHDPATNRITSPGHSYDAAGNLTRAQATSGALQRYEYDAAGRLARVLGDEGTVLETYTYGAGRERWIVERGPGAGVRTYYARAGGQVVAEYTDAGSNLAWAKGYVNFGARLLATMTPALRPGTAEVVQLHHPDRLGTRLITRVGSTGAREQVTLPFGTMLEAESAAPFGVISDGGVALGSQRFTSYDRSTTTGLDYAQNRFYDSLEGRFTQVDPIGMDAASATVPQSLNMFSYARNDPINNSDPDGLLCAQYTVMWGGHDSYSLDGTHTGGAPNYVWSQGVACDFAAMGARARHSERKGPVERSPHQGRKVPSGRRATPPNRTTPAILQPRPTDEEITQACRVAREQQFNDFVAAERTYLEGKMAEHWDVIYEEITDNFIDEVFTVKSFFKLNPIAVFYNRKLVQNAEQLAFEGLSWIFAKDRIAWGKLNKNIESVLRGGACNP